jgi:glutamate-ammonia-ligase adenylyltransferase
LSEPAVLAWLEAVFGVSPYLTQLCLGDKDRLADILSADPIETIDRHIASLEALGHGEADLDEAAMMRQLRVAKQQAALTVGLADLAKALDTMAVTTALARFADAALAAAVTFSLRAQADRGKIQLADRSAPAIGSGYIVLAMGKHGAFELNYSSDIDLIVFFEAARARPLLAEPDEVTDFFVRLTKQVVRLMQSITADGYVFRVDLRLRPDPGATAIAMSTDAAMQYYGSIGQNWERAALIKARPVAGDIEAGEAFLAELRPFIWRKSFDYAAINDVHSIKRQIHAAKGHGQIAVAGHDVKLGRGGIREIEFFVQTQQLIAGGRNPLLRGRQTLANLDALVTHGWIAASVRDDLRAAYLYLRDVEHRIQMVADQQTHRLPETELGLARIAAMMGATSPAAFADALLTHLATVQRHGDALFENAPALSAAAGSLVFTGAADDPETLETLSRMGFLRPTEVAAAIRAWHFGRYNATRSTVARERLTELTPALLRALAGAGNADETFRGFDRFVAGLPTGVQIFSLLASNPALLSLLAEILSGATPKLAETLTRRPRVIDALLEPEFFGRLPTEADLARHLDLTALDAGRAYATLGRIVVQHMLAVVAAELTLAHGSIPGGAAVVVALGKLGGGEMTAASDLDLMLLYDAPDEHAVSDGPRPLALSQYYARLVQRLVTALSALTGEGQLYPVDFRLRPSGNKGPLATSLKSFIAYQATEAWTWERMALTRAGVVAETQTAQDQPSGLGRRVEVATRDVLAAPRDPVALRRDVLAMRAMMASDKGSDDIWDLKHVAGGIVDIEFIAQYLQLLHGPTDPSVFSTHTRTALHRLAAAGWLAQPEAAVLLSALDLYGSVTQVMRLAQDGRFSAEEASERLRALVARAADLPSFAILEVHLKDTASAVRDCFVRLIGAPT